MNYKLIKPINTSLTPTEQILTSRGIPLKEIHHYMSTTDADIIPTSQLANLREGATMLVKHLLHGRIHVQVDSDCDGFTSAAVLINYLHKLGESIPSSRITYALHQDKSHGIDLDKIPSGTTLVICPDSSSNEFEKHAILRERGIEVLVLDHHHADRISVDACIINNQTCDYPNKSLSGVGVVFKFCQFLDELMNTVHAYSLLDLVALGEIADVMDLRNFETIHLIRKGLKQIRNPFISEMVAKNKAKLGDNLTPIGIAFYVAPYVNAVTRVGTDEEKLILFEAMLEHTAYQLILSTKRGCKGEYETLVTQAVRNCTNIKNRQTKLRDNDLEIIEELIKVQNLLDNKILLVTPSVMLDRNLCGLIANELTAKYQIPTLVLNNYGDYFEGSGRNFENSPLEDFREFCEKGPGVEFAAGHPNAFGFHVAADRIKDFLDYANTSLDNMDFTPCYKVDYIYTVQDMRISDIYEIAGLEPLWGQGVQESKIVIKGVHVTSDNLVLMGSLRNTLKITLPNGVACIKFKSSEEEFEQLFSESGCVIIDLVGTCSLNKYNGSITPQIQIESYEIISKQKYYF